MATGGNIELKDSEIEFSGNKELKKHFKEQEKVKSRILSAEQSNTSITYDNKFFLKLYRKVDKAINPDLEITQFLTEEAQFPHIPGFIGAIKWNYGNGSMVLGMMQEMVESHSDAWSYMLDKLNNYNEKILAKNASELELPELRGNFTDPAAFEDIPEQLKEMISGSVAEQARLLGVRTGEMHIALASNMTIPDFKPEPFSLHYQRSLYSSFQTLVRSTFQNQARALKKMPEQVRGEAEEIMGMKDQILSLLKRIYRKKIEASKIRIHGDYHLGQVLFTGKDFIILDFEGEPARSYSERRLKRSPLRDVCGMIRSFHYAAYGGIFLNERIQKEDREKLIPFAEQWYHYMSGFFMQSYLETVAGSAFIPENKEDLDIMMQTYLLEKAIYELNYELNNRPDWVIIPLRGIKAIIDQNSETRKSKLNTIYG
jgi:maltose alpha-D-glucosyltransferase/alpha-amylase